jgi:tetratricopeptide (TPR) repeat protein
MTQLFCTIKLLTRFSTIAISLVSVFALGRAASAEAELPSSWQERIRLGVHAYETGDSHWAFERTSKLMMDGESKFGRSDGRMARLYTNMGEVYSQQERYEYAIQCLKQGLAVAEKAYGANSLEAVPALIDLAQVYVHLGNYSQAQPLFKRALGIVDKPDDDTLLPYLAVIETDLGSMYFAEAKYEISEPHFKRAVTAATKALGANHQWTTTIEGMYAASLKQLGRTNEAKAIERAAVAKANEIQSPIFIWNKLIAQADAAIASKQFRDAEAALKRAMEASQKLPEEPMLQVVTLNKHGQMLLLQELPELAIAKFKQAQTLADAALGLEDKSVLEHAKQLADLESSKGQYLDAEPLYVRLVNHAKKEFGPESPQYMEALICLARLYNSCGYYQKATNNYSKVLPLLEKQYGSDSEKLVPILVELGKELHGRPYISGTEQKPEEYLLRADKIATQKFGKDSKELVEVLNVLSKYYERHLEWSKAAKTFDRIIAADEKIYGPENSVTVKALERYAGVLEMFGRKNAAAAIEARISKIKGPKSEADD